MTCSRRLLPWATIAFLSLLVVLSLSAQLTGVDPDTRWGLVRRAVFGVGVAGLLGAACLHGIRVLDRRLMSKSPALGWAGPELEIRSRSVQARAPSDEPIVASSAEGDRRWIALSAGALTVAIIGITYVGLVSVWRWTQWPVTTTYYGMLGDAFAQGKTYLPIEPAAELSNLQDPYSSWLGAGGIANLSYYQGRYYLYWGPAPAIALAMLKILGIPAPGDQAVVFVAVSSIFLLSSLIVLRLKRVYFGRLPLWLMIAGLVIAGTIHPMLWFQNSPTILTAAIASGQALLLGGTYFAIEALTDTNAGARSYAAAGALWGLAITTRLTTVASVIVLALGVAFFSFKRAGRMRRYKIEALNMVSMFALLGLMLGLYGWYNAIRFNSFFETGWSYHFTTIGVRDQIARGTLFSSRYLAQNGLYYLLAPIRPVSHFPYLRAVYGEYTPFNQLLPRLGVPADLRVEDASGLAFTAPTLLFAVLFARKWLYGETPRPSGRVVNGAPGPAFVDQGTVGSMLLLSGAAGALPVLLFLGSTVRYEMDFVPLLAVVAVLGMWRLYEDTRPYPIQSRLATGAIILIVPVGTLVSLLLAVSGAGSRFDDLNPALFSFLVNSLPHW